MLQAVDSKGGPVSINIFAISSEKGSVQVVKNGLEPLRITLQKHSVSVSYFALQIKKRESV